MRRTKGETAVLELKIVGKRIRQGRIPIPELVRICEEAQNAVLRQAEAVEGRKTIHPGPARAFIREACTLELTGIKRGSTLLQFGLANPQLPLQGAEMLGRDAVREVGSAIGSMSNGHRKDIDPGVLQALYEFTGVLERNQINEVQWIGPKNGARSKRIRATIDKSTRTKVAARLSAPKTAVVRIDGILDMADFKPGERKCRVDPAIGVSITCTFDPEQENSIYELLRMPVRIIGRAIVKPYTDRVESVHIEDIRRLHSLEMGGDVFFSGLSIDELAKAQNVKALQNINVLEGGISEDEDVDDFLREIYEHRQ